MKTGLKYLGVAAGTLLFYIAGLPVADAIASYIVSSINVKTSKLQYILAQDQKEMEEIADKINGSGPVCAIGFQVDSQEGEEYDG